MEQLPYSTLVPGEVAHSLLTFINATINLTRFLCETLPSYNEEKIAKKLHELPYNKEIKK